MTIPFSKFNQMFQTQQQYDTAMSKILNQSTANKWNGFIVKQKKIIYQPANLTVINPEHKIEILNKLLKDEIFIGKSATSIYKTLQLKYIGFTLKQIKEIVSADVNKQLQYNEGVKIINKPLVVEKHPNSLWCTDLIDTGTDLEKKNKNYRYILTCVDSFSRYIWLRPLKSKEADEIADAMQSIIDEAGISPNRILSDNGLELKNQVFNEMCENNQIKHIYTDTYSPNQNLAERYNKTVRKLMRAHFLKNRNFNWISHLYEISNSMNNSYISSIKTTPKTIWKPSRTKLRLRDMSDTMTQYNPSLRAMKTILKTANDKISKFREREDTVHVGMFCRVKMEKLFAGVRKAIKEGNSKQIVVYWSPTIFQIHRVIHSTKKTLMRNRYVLTDEYGNVVSTPKKGVKQFFLSDLMLVNPDETTTMTVKKALQLNQVEESPSDVVFKFT